MNIIILHLHGICPQCGKHTCIYADYDKDEDGIEIQRGWECGSCGGTFDDFVQLEMTCPSPSALEKNTSKEVKG